MMMKRILIFIWLLAAPAQISSQIGIYQINLLKENLSWNWLGRLNGDFRINPKTRFTFDNQFSSKLFLKTIRGNNWRDDNNFKSFFSYRISSLFQSSIHFKSQIFSDDNSFVKFSKNLLYHELKYTPNPWMEFSPAIGFAAEDVYSFRDQGWYTQLNTRVNQYNLSGYRNTTNGFSSLFFFPNRRNQEHRYFVAFSKSFSSQASDSFQVGYEYVENSYPLPLSADGESIKSIEEVQVNSRYLYNELRYHFSSRSHLNIETKLQSRDLDQNNPSLLNSRDELNFANRIGLHYQHRRIITGFTFSTSQVTNLSLRQPLGLPESRTDYDGLQSAFNLFMDWQMTSKDKARLTFSYTKYEFKSPDSTQAIDEDDLRFIIDLIYQHRFNPYFSLEVNANLYLYHQIYIHPSRSANNNWNRIFLLAPSLLHQINDSFQHRFQIKILANYTVYDFEELLPEVRSFIFRKLVYTDSLRIKLGSGLRFQTIYQLEKEDNGTFFQDIFAQQVNRELTSHLIDVGLVYTGMTGIQLITALNWYLRKEWSLVPDRRIIRDYRAFSPRISIRYNLGQKLQFLLSYSPRSYRDINIPKKYFTMGRFDLRYFF
jgi:hypothetical protein